MKYCSNRFVAGLGNKAVYIDIQQEKLVYTFFLLTCPPGRIRAVSKVVVL